jgi:hypothetical protein
VYTVRVSETNLGQGDEGKQGPDEDLIASTFGQVSSWTVHVRFLGFGLT